MGTRLGSPRTDALLPTDRDQRGGDVVDPALRSQHIELRGSVPGIEDLDPHPQAADVPPQLRTDRPYAGPGSQYQYVCVK